MLWRVFKMLFRCNSSSAERISSDSSSTTATDSDSDRQQQQHDRDGQQRHVAITPYKRNIHPCISSQTAPNHAERHGCCFSLSNIHQCAKMQNKKNNAGLRQIKGDGRAARGNRWSGVAERGERGIGGG